MQFDNSNNPFFREKSVAKAKAETLKKRQGGPFFDPAIHMTVDGAVNRTFILIGLMMISFSAGFLFPSSLFLLGGGITAFIIFLITGFKPHIAPTTAPIYALVQGLFVGTASSIYASMYEGIIFQAFSLTVACLLTMLILYRSGLVKVTRRFRMGVSMAVGAVMIVYIIAFIGQFAGFTVPFLHEGGMAGIAITLVIIGIACLNLLLDFDNFDKGESMEMPKYMEWYYGMGLLFTLIWLYIELLNLLSKIRD